MQCQHRATITLAWWLLESSVRITEINCFCNVLSSQVYRNRILEATWAFLSFLTSLIEEAMGSINGLPSNGYSEKRLELQHSPSSLHCDPKEISLKTLRTTRSITVLIINHTTKSGLYFVSPSGSQKGCRKESSKTKRTSYISTARFTQVSKSCTWSSTGSTEAVLFRLRLLRENRRLVLISVTSERYHHLW